MNLDFNKFRTTLFPLTENQPLHMSKSLLSSTTERERERERERAKRREIRVKSGVVGLVNIL